MNKQFYKYVSYVTIILAVLPIAAILVPGLKIPLVKLSYSTVYALLALWAQREYRGCLALAALISTTGDYGKATYFMGLAIYLRI